MRIVLLSLAVVGFVIVNVLGVTLYTSPLGFSFNTESTNLEAVLPLGGSMLIGVVASSLVAALKQMPQNRPVHFSKLIPVVLRPNTFIALLVSPVVFYGIVVALGDGSIGPLLYLASFQNGFFWQTALVPPNSRPSA